MAQQQQNANLTRIHEAMNKLLRDMQADLQQLSKNQQALFNAVSDALGPKKAPKDKIKSALDHVHNPLKALDAHLKEYANHARNFALEGTKDDKKPQPKPKPTSPKPNGPKAHA